MTAPRHKNRWVDLVIKICAVLVLGYLVGRFVLDPLVQPKHPSDREKWSARPKLGARNINSAETLKHTQPCLFLVPADAKDQPVTSGSVDSCLVLKPDGKQLDLFEFNLRSALLFPVSTDLYVPGGTPLAFTRTYFPVDDGAREFRILLPHVYNPYLTGSRKPYTYMNWLLPDRQTIHFNRISTGSSFDDFIGESTSDDSAFSGSRIAWNGWGWDLALTDGTTFLSPEAYNSTRPQQGSMNAIFDAAGNETQLERASNGDLQEISSPSGQWIRLSYSGAGQLVSVRSSLKEECRYEYDSQGRLRAATRADGSVLYSYDSSNQLISVVDSSRKISIALQGQLPALTLSLNGMKFAINATSDSSASFAVSGFAHVDVTDNAGKKTRVRFFADPSHKEPGWSVDPN